MTEQRTVVLVTGASGALGSTLVRRLAARHTVIATDRRAHAAALAGLAAENGNVTALELDSSSAAEWTAALARVTEQHGVVTGAALIAGGYAGGARLFDDSSGETWRRMLDQNLESARGALEALLPGMVRAARGSVVLIGSKAAVRPWESGGSAAYAASKAALIALAQATASEVVDDGVRINVVLPSTIDTPRNRESMPRADASRWVKPESLCDVIEFLLSDAARDVSGAAVPVFGRTGI